MQTKTKTLKKEETKQCLKKFLAYDSFRSQATVYAHDSLTALQEAKNILNNDIVKLVMLEY